jgi:CheY-like chemotaxis protein
VLVVDDVLTNLQVARGMLKPYRIEVDCVTSGQQAVDAVKKEQVKYNAIFMDHMMPDMDGIEAARVIREEIGTEYAKKVPLIAFTANALTGNEEMFLSCGFQAYLSKPIEAARLDVVIREWVRDEEQEKLLAEKKITVGAETFFDPRRGQDRRMGRDRRRGYDRRLFEQKVEGMDMRRGLERFNGDMDAFLQVLQTFTSNTKNILNTMRDVNKENLTAYGVNVHGVKSSCRSICAEALGEKAETLEKAAKAGDLAYVTENNQPFIEEVFKLIKNVEAALLLGGVGVERRGRLKKDRPYREALTKLRTACEEYKIADIEEAIKELECFEYTDDGGLVQWLHANADQMNYSDIVEKLSGKSA